MRLPSSLSLASSLAAGIALYCCAVAPASAQTPPPAPTPALGGKGSIVNPPLREVVRAEERSAPALTENAPQPMGYESDVHCFGYVGALRETFPARVVSAENLAEQTDYITGDLLFLNGGYDRGLKVGDQFWLVTPEEEIFHPVTARSFGRFYQQRGQGIVMTVEPRTAVMRVTSSCTDIPIGAFLKPFEPVPIPLARKSPPAVIGDAPSGKARGRIVYTRDGIVSVGQDHSVIVDLGAAEGVAPGDFLTVYRYATGRDFGVHPVGGYWVSIPNASGVVVPRTYLGEGAVLMTGDHWSILRVTDSFRLIEVGDEVELK